MYSTYRATARFFMNVASPAITHALVAEPVDDKGQHGALARAAFEQGLYDGNADSVVR